MAPSTEKKEDELVISNTSVAPLVESLNGSSLTADGGGGSAEARGWWQHTRGSTTARLLGRSWCAIWRGDYLRAIVSDVCMCSTRRTS